MPSARWGFLRERGGEATPFGLMKNGRGYGG